MSSASYQTISLLYQPAIAKPVTEGQVTVPPGTIITFNPLTDITGMVDQTMIIRFDN